MYLVGFLFYVLLCGALAWLLARVLTRRAKEPCVRWVVAGVLAPIVFLLPLADEIVGYFQFERLCEEAKEVKIYGSIPVGEELYTTEGKWRIGLREGDWDSRRKDRDRLQKALDSYVRWDLGPRAQEVSAAIPIQRYESKIYDVKTGQLLAEWRKYGAYGGWFSRNMIPDGRPLIVRPQCMPEIVLRSEIHQALLKFTKPSEATK